MTQHFTNRRDSTLQPTEAAVDQIFSTGSVSFDTVLVECRTNRGTPYWRKEPVGVPKIPDSILDMVFYLYPSVEDARAGTKVGGTGFFVCVRSEAAPGQIYPYAVTNWHVAVQYGNSVLRVNTKDGGTEIIELGPEDWEFDAHAGHDVAVAPLRVARNHALKYSYCPFDMLIEKTRFSPDDKIALGVGDEVFMVGRFIDHDGGPTNQPAARFGSISIKPTKLKSALGKLVDTICLDTNSRTGFSGSPVIVYRTTSSDLVAMANPDAQGKAAAICRPVFMLLGVHTGQFPEYWDYREGKQADAEAEAASAGQVRGLSGMTRVAPAWAIRALIDSPILKGERDRSEAELKAHKALSASLPSGEENREIRIRKP